MTEREYSRPSRTSRLGIVGTLAGLALSAIACNNNLPGADRNQNLSASTPTYSNNSSGSTKVSYKTSDFSTDSDEVLLARMILGEAGNCSHLERVAVGYTAVNRANDGKKWNGETLREALLWRKKYSCFNFGDSNRTILMNPDKYSPETFRDCLKASEEILSGKISDPTNGATHYYSPEGMRKIRIDKIKNEMNKLKNEHKPLIKKLEKAKKTKANKRKLNAFRNYLNHNIYEFEEELEKARTEAPPKPYWAKPPLHEIGRINVGFFKKSKHVFYK